MKRPASVTVFGVLNLLGGIVTGCGMILLALMFAMPLDPQTPDPLLEIMAANRAFRTYNYVMVGLGFVGMFVLFTAGVGLLKLAPWGRSLSIGYGVGTIACALLGMVVNYFALYGPLMQKAAELPPGARQDALTTAAINSLTVGGLGLIVYPVLLLFFMCRPNVVAAFADASASEDAAVNEQRSE